MILPPGLYSRGSALDIGLKQSFDQSAANGCSDPILKNAARRMNVRNAPYDVFLLEDDLQQRSRH